MTLEKLSKRYASIRSILLALIFILKMFSPECSVCLSMLQVFQRRINGEVDFYRNWDSYVNGFGSKNGEFWLGKINSAI